MIFQRFAVYFLEGSTLKNLQIWQKFVQKKTNKKKRGVQISLNKFLHGIYKNPKARFRVLPDTLLSHGGWLVKTFYYPDLKICEKGSLEPWCIKDGQWVFWRWAIVSLRLFGKCTCLAFFVSTEVLRFSAGNSFCVGKRAQWAKTRKIVHFGRTMHCLPQKLKSTGFFFNFFEWMVSEGNREGRKNFKNADYSLSGCGNRAKPPKHIFEIGFIFALWIQKKYTSALSFLFYYKIFSK